MLISSVLRTAILAALVYSAYQAGETLLALLTSLSSSGWVKTAIVLGSVLVTCLRGIKRIDGEITNELRELTSQSFKDSLSLLMTAFLIVSLFGIPYLWNLPAKPDSYFNAIGICCIYALADLICVPAYAILVILPWRLKRAFSAAKLNSFKRSQVVLTEAMSALVDLPFLVLLFLVLLTVIDSRAILREMKNSEVTAWRRIIWSYVTDIPVNLFFVTSILLTIVTVVHIPKLFWLIGGVNQYRRLEFAGFMWIVVVTTPLVVASYLLVCVTYYRLKNLGWGDINKILYLPEYYADWACDVAKQTILLIVDLPFVILAGLSFVFVWRIPKTIKSLKISLQQGSVASFKRGVKDIVAAVLGLVTIATMYRLKYLVKLYKALATPEADHPLFQACVICLKVHLNDLLCLVPFLFIIVLPWRYRAIKLIFQLDSPYQQHELILSTFKSLLGDLPYLLVVLVTVIEPRWSFRSSIRACLSGQTDTVIREILWANMKDALMFYWAVLCFAVLLVTLVRLPLMSRLHKAFKPKLPHPFRSAVFDAAYELVYDLPFLPFGLIVIVTFWKLNYLCTALPKMEPYKQRREIQMKSIEGLVDLVVYALTLPFLVITVWRIPTVFTANAHCTSPRMAVWFAFKQMLYDLKVAPIAILSLLSVYRARQVISLWFAPMRARDLE
jgi:hypothetical protein